MGLKQVQIDNVDKLPQGAPHPDSAPWTQPRLSLDWRVTTVLCLFVLLLILVGAWLLRDWFQYGSGGTALIAVFVLVFVYALLMALRSVLLVDQRGYKVFIWNANAPKVIEQLIKVDREYAARMFPNAAQLTLTQAPAQQVLEDDAIDGEVVEGEIPPALLPPDEWLPWFDTRPHGLLAAETGGGKSTLFKLITKSRIERGELVFLLDPHSSDWFGLPGIGGGEDWEAIWCGMQVVIGEYRARLEARESYLQQYGREKPTDEFPRITVLLDEANTACRKFSTAKRGEESRWEQFAEALGSGARKVNLSIQLLAQSPNVEDLELSRPMLNNFTRICLDSYTAQLLIQKSLDEKEQKQALTRALQGQAFPAATTIKGYAVLLDRTGLDRITSPVRPERSLWTEGYQRAEQLIAEMRRPKVAPRTVTAAYQQSAPLRATIPAEVPILAENEPIESSATVATTATDDVARDEMIKTLRRLKGANGKPIFSQDAIRVEIERAGWGVAQARLVALCQEVDMA